uniref:FBX41/ZN365 C2H2-type zinc finger domain-containing protein n=1 Tax=Knipowitschia caucasica TaxID=637954 RepID=A0AAV2KMD3_KNICA
MREKPGRTRSLYMPRNPADRAPIPGPKQVWTMSGLLICPRCGDAFKFSTIADLRVHLITRHTYETLLLLSQARVRTSRPRSLLPLAGPMLAQIECSMSGTELQQIPLPLESLDLASSTSSVQLLQSMVLPRGKLTETFLRVDIGLEERLGLGVGLGPRIARTLEEVEQRVNRKVERLKSRLQQKDEELQRQRIVEETLRTQKQELNEHLAHLTGQVSAAEELMSKLLQELEAKETELNYKQQEMVEIECFLNSLAQREAEAKVKLQVFIESLLERADRAERHLLLITSHKPSPHRGSLDEIITSRLQESIGNRVRRGRMGSDLE